MKGEPGPVLHLLRPVLDTYRDSAVAVVGCNSTGIARESCEIDAVVVSDERRNPASLKVGDSFCDLGFINEREALNPSDPETAVSLAQSKVVRDSGLILSTSLAANQAVLEKNAARASQQRLAACLKDLSRTDEALLKGVVRDANFWILSASYEFARAWLYSMEVIPSPSHMLGQLKEHSRGGGKNFEAFAESAGLEIASRKEAAVRLEALSLLYDLLAAPGEETGTPPSASAEVRFQIVKRKAEHLAILREHAEGYSFLGGEVASAVTAVSLSVSEGGSVQRPDKTVLSSLVDAKGGGLLSARLVRELGLDRPAGDIAGALDVLKERAAKLARRI